MDHFCFLEKPIGVIGDLNYLVFEKGGVAFENKQLTDGDFIVGEQIRYSPYELN